MIPITCTAVPKNIDYVRAKSPPIHLPADRDSGPFSAAAGVRRARVRDERRRKRMLPAHGGAMRQFADGTIAHLLHPNIKRYCQRTSGTSQVFASATGLRKPVRV